MNVTKTFAGKIGNAELFYVELKNNWMKVAITNFGASITSIFIPDKDGIVANIVLNYNKLEDYFADQFYIGSTIGRVCGRISNSKFTINNKTFHLTSNETTTGNHLHGGFDGFNKKVFNILSIDFDENKASVILHYQSEDLEEGYPGKLDVWITFTLTADNKLAIQYKAITNKTTHVNLTNHTYFNLTGNSKLALEQELVINAKTILETDTNYIPTGGTKEIKNTAYDFTSAHLIKSFKTLLDKPGYNECYLLDKTNTEEDAILFDSKSNRKITFKTSYPAIIFYSGDYLDTPFKPCEGVCLEAQYLPDTPNRPEFKSTLLSPGEVYNEYVSLKFSN